MPATLRNYYRLSGGMGGMDAVTIATIFRFVLGRRCRYFLLVCLISFSVPCFSPPFLIDCSFFYSLSRFILDSSFSSSLSHLLLYPSSFFSCLVSFQIPCFCLLRLVYFWIPSFCLACLLDCSFLSSSSSILFALSCFLIDHL